MRSIRSRRKEAAVRQRGPNDCGAACLCAVAASYYKPVPMWKIRRLTGSSPNGTSVKTLLAAAGQTGFRARAVRTTAEHLQAAPFPLIAHLLHDHYVVIYGCSKTHVRIMDPAHGAIQEEAREDFEKKWSGILILLEPKDGSIFRSMPLRRVLQPALRPHIRTLALVTVFGILYTMMGLAGIVLVRKLVDHAVGAGHISGLHRLGGTMLAVVLGMSLLHAWKAILTHRVALALDRSLLSTFYRNILRLKPEIQQQMSPGELMNRMQDAGKIRRLLTELCPQALLNGMMLAGALLLMWLLHPALSLYSTLFLLLLLFLLRQLDRLNTKRERSIAEASAAFESRALDTIVHTNVFRHVNRQDQAAGKTDEKLDELLQASAKALMPLMGLSFSCDMAVKALAPVLLWAGACYMPGEQLSPGELISFFVIAGFMTTPLIAFFQLNKPIRESLVAAERYEEILAMEKEPVNEDDNKAAPLTHRISLKRISVQDGSSRLLNNINMDIPAGSFIAITGKNGSGKSTLCKLLIKEWTCSKGAITWDNRAYEELTPGYIRDQVGYVPQRVNVLNDTLLFNIVLDRNCHISNLRRAIRESGLQELIARLPAGLNTVMERGFSLSGGELRKLGLARLLYRAPPVFLLDELTEGLDARSEQDMLSLLRKYNRKGHTIVLVTHTHAGLAAGDVAYIMENGDIVEKGGYEELKKHSGIFRELFGNDHLTGARST